MSRRGIGKFEKCGACQIEAEIGTEDSPHPVPARFHTCLTLPNLPRCSGADHCRRNISDRATGPHVCTVATGCIDESP